jgi:CheY-like chemotaxis protein
MNARTSNLVFIVEDSPIITELTKRFISDRFFKEIECFEKGEDMLQQLHRSPEFILLDFFLDTKNKSSLNGLQIIERIKQVSPEVPVLVLTGAQNEEIIAQLEKSGIQGLVNKNDMEMWNELETKITQILKNEKAV